MILHIPEDCHVCVFFGNYKQCIQQENPVLLIVIDVTAKNQPASGPFEFKSIGVVVKEVEHLQVL